MAAKTIAEQAKAAGVTRLVQISAIGADANSESKYLRTKAEGEAAVRAAFPGAVIDPPVDRVRPTTSSSTSSARWPPASPPCRWSAARRFQPVYVGDVAAVIAKAVSSPEAEGLTYELGGPTVYTMRQILEMILTETGRARGLLPLPWFAASLIGKAGDVMAGIIPLAPPLTSDQVELLKSDNVAEHGLPGLAEAGVVPTSVEAIVPSYLYRYRKGGQYAATPAGAF
jgi:uncharacterized protein YbjT (DUF2867 family)